MRSESGFTLLEVLITLALSVMLFLVVIAAYSQGNTIKAHVQGTVTAQANVRVAIEQLERDLRMIGFAVPTGERIGTTVVWTPAVFRATPTELGFRAEIDGGRSEIVCTPSSSNGLCPLNVLRLDSVQYHDNLNCDAPDGSGNLKVIAVVDGGDWQPLTCSAVDVSNSRISVTTVTDDTFAGGSSEALTIEQLHLEYVPASQPPYGYLARKVTYVNNPSATFPGVDSSWSVVADHLTDFSLEYQDDSGTTITGNPLSAANRALIRKIVVSIEGFDQGGPDSKPQLARSRSEILVRN